MAKVRIFKTCRNNRTWALYGNSGKMLLHGNMVLVDQLVRFGKKVEKRPVLIEGPFGYGQPYALRKGKLYVIKSRPHEYNQEWIAYL